MAQQEQFILSGRMGEEPRLKIIVKSGLLLNAGRVSLLLYGVFLWGYWFASIPPFLRAVRTDSLPQKVVRGNSAAELVAERLSAWPLTPEAWAWMHLVVNGLGFLIFSLVALFILWRGRSSFGFLTAFVLLLAGSSAMDVVIYAGDLSYTALITWELGAVVWPVFFLWLYLFPNGVIAPAKSIWFFLPPWVLFTAAFLAILVGTLFSTDPPATLIFDLVFEWLSLALFLVILITQIFRYRFFYGRVERAQVKWFIFALFVFIAISIIVPSIERFPTEILSLSFNLIPIALGIAVLRYRLWDIDVIIRRTLLYTLMTGLMALIYFGSIVLLQTVFGWLIEERSPLAVVISTLLIAALFNPLRRRVQDFIDLRFYRQKYDAEQSLERFSRNVRDSVDINQLSGELIGLLDEMIQPEQTILWIRKDRKP